ncbi:hypothetical protein SynNOUM97013_02548 [Synechococcus sp. NOUM97013]|nr:hypothetical protein SynNOUM97013_02548 [Synechococcus sp. NOUM97013]
MMLALIGPLTPGFPLQGPLPQPTARTAMPRTTSQATTTRNPAPRARRSSGSRRSRRAADNSDVLVSAVISSYLLTHLHHVLQRAEYGAVQEGRTSQAANYAQLRKVLCMDARSMEDASACGLKESDHDQAA